MSTKSTWKTTAFSYAVASACIGGYALTKHSAFLFLYSLVSWFALFAVLLVIWGLWKVFKSGNTKDIDRLYESLVEVREKLRFSVKLVLGYTFTFTCMGILLYWEAYKTVLPLILVTTTGFFIRYMIISIVDNNEQEQST